jgi:hypothetical protein
VSPGFMRVGQTLFENDESQNQKSPMLTVVVAALTSPLPAWAATANTTVTTANFVARRSRVSNFLLISDL